MALYPGADVRLLPAGVNHNKGGCNPRMFVIHIMEGDLWPTDAMFRDPKRQASAHFGVGRTGKVLQWVSTTDTAWHAFAANAYGIGVEHSGFASEGLSDQQIEATGKLYAWAHKEHPAIRLWLNVHESGSGLAYHRQYADWNLSNHSCPGDKAIKQLPKILEAAKAHS